MEFSIPREVRTHEGRVALTPAGVGALVAADHQVYIEHDAGAQAGFADEAYRLHGGLIVYSADEAYGRGEVVIKVSRPTAEESRRFRFGQTLLSFLHLAVASPDLLEAMQATSMSAVAWELVRNTGGQRPVMSAMSDIAGRLAPIIAGTLLQTTSGGRGILLSGLPGVPPASVVVLGAGELGGEAARAFMKQGSHVVVLDSDLTRLRAMDARFDGRIVTMQATPSSLRRAVSFADVLVGAVALPGQRAPVLVSREMVRAMKPGAVILDFAVDSGGCVETTRPTTHQDPTYVEAGVVHYAVPTVPAGVARTASYAMTNAILPYLLAIGEQGAVAALRDVPELVSGLVVREGQLVHPEVARSLGREVQR